MASKNIKGITIEIDGETRGLEKALGDVNSQSKKIQGELKEVDRLLKFNPGNTEALAQKQELLAKQIDNTSDKLKQLKDAQSQVQAQFERGDIGEEQYRAFRREIEFTEGTLGKLQRQMAGLQAEQERVQQSTRQLERLFEATGTSVDDFSNALGGKLTRAIKEGTASSKQLDEAISKVGREALGADADLDKMKKALDSVDDGKSIDKVRQDLKKMGEAADESKESIKDAGTELANMAAGLAAGGGLAGIVEKSLDLSSLDTKIEISMEVPPESIESVKAAVRTVSAYGVDIEESLEGVRRQWALNKDASDETNAAIVQGAATIAGAYAGIDFTELIQETNEISSALKISDEDALGLVNSLLKIGFPPEQLDIIAEYGTQLQMAGYDAEEIQAIMAAGVETGSWNIDNLLDGLKEGRIRVSEFGEEVPKAMKELLEGTNISSKQLQEWGQAVAAGGDEGKQAMQEVAEALLGVDDETKRNLLGVQLFGTMYEDQGEAILQTLMGARDATSSLKDNQDQLNESVEAMSEDPAVQMQEALQSLQTTFAPVLTAIAEIVAKIAEWIQNNPTLTATITAVVTVIGLLVGLLAGLAPIFTAIGTAAGVLGVSIGAVTVPVLAVIAAIGLLVAAGVAIYKNWDTIKAKTIEVWNSIKDFLSTLWDTIRVAAGIVWDALKIGIAAAWNAIKSTTSTLWNSIKGVLATVWNSIKSSVAAAINGVRSTVSNAWNGIRSLTTSIWNGIKSAISTAVNNVLSTVTRVFNSMKNAISNTMNRVFNTIREIWGRVTSFFSGIDLSSIGKNIIQGLIDGVKSMARSLVNSVKDVVGGAIEGAKNLLGIKSPSRVFMQIGKHTGEGMEIGMKRMMGNVAKAGESLAAASIPNAPTIPVGMSGFGTSTVTPEVRNSTINMSGLFDGAVFNVREEQDIRKLAKELNDYIKQSARGGGVVMR